VKTLDSTAQIAIRQARLLQVFICDGHQVKADVESERIYDEELTLTLNMDIPLPKIAYCHREEQMGVEDETGPLVEHDYCRLKSRAEVELIRERDLLRAELARVKKDNLVLKRLLHLSQIRCSKVKKRLAIVREGIRKNANRSVRRLPMLEFLTFLLR
jgi:hypothetical protein